MDEKFSNASVLIVEDDESYARLLVSNLQTRGFKTEVVSDSKTALEKSEEIKFDVIILDLILPGESGFELLEKFRNNPTTADIPILVLSNLGQDRNIEQALSLGANDFIVKIYFPVTEIPYRLESILRTADFRRKRI
ncbi:MAG: response regulator [Patescibacteria group bacterium]